MTLLHLLTHKDKETAKPYASPQPRQRFRAFVLSCEAFCWVLVVAAPLALVTPAYAQSDSARIVQLEHDWLDARDAVTLDRILDSTFVHVTPQGAFLDKREHVAWMADHWPPPNRVAHFERLSVRIYGSTAIATGIVSARVGSAAARRTAFTDVFIERRDGWKAVSAEETVMP